MTFTAPTAMVAVVRPAVAPRHQPVPLAGVGVHAGFPSPADDHVEAGLDLNELLVRHREATFFVRVKGRSMEGAGIRDGDLLVVDRSLTPTAGKIVIAVLDGDFTVKVLRVKAGRVWLEAASPDYPPLAAGNLQELVVWGVVTGVVRQV